MTRGEHFGAGCLSDNQQDTRATTELAIMAVIFSERRSSLAQTSSEFHSKFVWDMFKKSCCVPRPWHTHPSGVKRKKKVRTGICVTCKAIQSIKVHLRIETVHLYTVVERASRTGCGGYLFPAQQAYGIVEFCAAILPINTVIVGHYRE